MASSSIITSFAIALIAGAAVFFVASMILSLAWPFFHRRQAQLSPKHYARALLVYAALPAIVAAATIISCAGVPLSAGFNVVPTHCHVNVAGGICVPHDPVPASQIPFGLIAFSVFFMLVSAACLIGQRLWVHSILCRNLRLCSSYSRELDAWLIDTDSALAFCAGVMRRRVFVSRGMVARLSESELEIVLNHERLHAKSLHGVFVFVLQLLTALFMPRAKDELMHEYLLAAEHACDSYAAERCGDRLAVADILVKLGRIRLKDMRQAQIDDSAYAFSVFGQSIDRRVSWLVEAPEDGGPGLSIILERLVCYMVIAAFMAGEPIHQSLEKAHNALMALNVIG